MEGHQSKCNYCIHTLLGCFHYPSCAFKSECENCTLGLPQRFVGLVLLELSESSSRAASQSGNNFSRAMVMLLTSVSEKQRTNISTDRSGTAPKSAFWFVSVHTSYIWRFSTAWYGTVRYGTVHFWGVFHWVLYLVPDTFLVPLRSRFHRAVPLPKRDV